MFKILIVLALLSSHCFASGFNGSAKLASNYLWRGMTFSDNEPVISLSANYEHESGFYGNLFGTNLKWAEPTLYAGFSKKEMDLSFGHRKYFGDWSTNIFVNRYEFIDQSSISGFEYSAGLSYKSTTLEYYLFPDWFGFKTQSHYLRLNHTHAISEKFSLVGGLGRNEQSRTKRFQDSNGNWKGAGFTSYFDMYLGLQIKEVNGFLYEFLYSNTDRQNIAYFSDDSSLDGKKSKSQDQSLTVSLTKFF